MMASQGSKLPLRSLGSCSGKARLVDDLVLCNYRGHSPPVAGAVEAEEDSKGVEGAEQPEEYRQIVACSPGVVEKVMEAEQPLEQPPWE